MSVLVAAGVSKVFGAGRRRRAALQDCSLRVATGEIVGLVGPNGAGKTTLLRLVAGELPLSAGTLLVDGHRAGTRAARRAVGYAADPPVAPAELTGAEWLGYLASQRALTTADRERLVRWAVEFGELEAFVGRRIGTYSHGMAQRLGLAAAGVLQPSVLVLDEVLSGVDPLVHRRLREQIARYARTGVAVLIATHDLSAVERLATRVLLLWSGRVVADVATATLAAERVVELSLAGSALADADRLVARYPGALRTGLGVSVPLTRGLSVEAVLAACRDERLAVAGSQVRYRALEDLLVTAARERGEPV